MASSPAGGLSPEAQSAMSPAPTNVHGVTTNCAIATLSCATATMETVPVERPVTSPVESMLAILESELSHAI